MEEFRTAVVYKGRTVTSSTKWWAEHTKISYDELYCIHSVKLNAKCEECNASNNGMRDGVRTDG